MVNDLSPGSYFKFYAGYRGNCPRCGTKAVTFKRLFPETINELFLVRVMVLRCEHCQRAFTAETEVLSTDTGNTRMFRFYPPAGVEVTPSPFLPEGSGIVESLQEARLCGAVGAVVGGCMLARRAIQLVVRDRGASGKNLADEIDSLEISEDLKTVAHSIRLIGNEAAHPDLDDWSNVTSQDLLMLLGLISELVRQLYDVPGAVQQLRQRTEELSGKDPAGSAG